MPTGYQIKEQDKLHFVTEEYKYSSAIDYAGEKGLLKVEPIMRQWKTYR